MLERIEPSARAILEDVSFEAMTYVSDGLAVHGYLARPRSGSDHPCVIYNRGGNRSFGALDDGEVLLSLGPLAQAGYVVVASQYRGHLGTAGRDEFGGADLNDVLNLIPLLESLPGADATRIGMVGWSRGGMMTYMALTRTDRIAGAVVGAGAADLIHSAERRPELARVFSELIPRYAEDAEQQLTRRSAVYWPGAMHKQTPLLVLHGADDWRVDPRQALTLAEKLLDAQHPFRLVFFERGDHGLTQYRSEVQALMRDWLDRYVRHHRESPALAADGS
jgi:dipeptidyl aminopeptidase/acylaminoacyl peptidase